MLRLVKNLEKIQLKFISPIPKSLLNEISSKFIKSQGEGQTKEQTEKLLDTIRTEYNREMKWSFLIEILKNPKLVHRFQVEQIEYLTPPPKPGHYGLLQQGLSQSKFKERLSNIKRRNFFKIKESLASIALFQQRCDTYSIYMLFNFEIPLNTFPLSLEQFVGIQSDYFAKNKEILKTQWKEYPLGDIWDILRKVPEFNKAFNDLDQY